VHDILQSPAALRNVVDNLRPGAWVAAGGGKWASPPWSHLEPLIEDVQVREMALGSGYIMTGHVPTC
jgi:hypothetical protein